ncbi:MAG: hypothetical protein ABIR10_03035, partial [Dokdonella sp.]
DTHYNGGIVIDDRFAATTIDNRQIAQKMVKLPDGDVVVAGLVPAAFQANQGDGGYNLGLVRYGSDGSRVQWSAPTPAFAWYFDHYLGYPNTGTAKFTALRDLQYAGGRIYALVDYAYSASDTDVFIVTFDEQGTFVAMTPAFTTSLVEFGAGLVASFGHLTAVATYNPGRSVITLKRFDLASDGTLTVDTSFGHVGNGAIDQPMPDGLCASPPCSGVASAVTALRTETPSPTIYIVGYAIQQGADWDAMVMAIDGSTGDLASTFGSGSGIYTINGAVPGTSSNDIGRSIVATTSGSPTSDVIYVGATWEQPCGSVSAITKLFASVPLPGGPFTTPDFFWATGGTLLFGGDASAAPCSNGSHVTVPRAMAIDGNRLAIVGQDDLIGVITLLRGPMLAIVRVSDGVLTEFTDHIALRADGTAWGASSLDAIVSDGNGRFVATGTMRDSHSTLNGQLFGTMRFAADRIFGDGFGE